MREILFRGKPLGKLHDNFIYGSLGVICEDLCAIYYCHEFIDDDIQLVDIGTVGQYTGLTDKNGKKIFEGDIVKHHFGEEKGIVKFGEYRQPFNDDIHTKHIGFYVDWISGEQKELLRKDLGYWANIDNDYEIFIGNIHDNPELLKEAEQK